MANWDNYINEKLKSRNYAYRNDAKKDISSAIRMFEDLHPEESVYVSEETQKQLTILALTGTIPVAYKGSSYNIPIMIQLLHGFPHQPPLVFVKPTSTMVIKPSRHVDDKGRVYLPLLTEWQNQRQNIGIIDLIKQLQITFGQTPPVYAKSAQQPAPPPRPAYAAPYPANQSGGYVPHGGMPMPGGANHQPHQGYQPPYPTSTPGYPSPSGSAYPRPSNPSGQGMYPGQGGSQYPTNPPYPAGQNVAPSYPGAGAASTTAQPNDVSRQGSTIDDKMVRMSLMSTAEDKLKQRIREVFEMGRIEQEQLQITRVQLESGNKELTSMIQQMNDEKANIEANISLLEQKNAEIDDTLAKMESDSANMNIDEAVVTTIPIHSQILDLYAEESAIEDTLYYLTEGLRREVVELDVFLKSVRKMSRKQFMLRATLLKAREVAGLSR